MNFNHTALFTRSTPWARWASAGLLLVLAMLSGCDMTTEAMLASDSFMGFLADLARQSFAAWLL